MINVIDNKPLFLFLFYYTNQFTKTTSEMATLTTTSNFATDAVAVIQVNDHEISTEDSTWRVFNAETDTQPASLWTRIHRIVKDALGYSSNTTVPSTGVAIPDPFNA